MSKRIPTGIQSRCVQDFLHGRKTVDAIAEEQGVSKKTVREWVRTWRRGAEMRELSHDSRGDDDRPAPAPKKTETPKEKPAEKPAAAPAGEKPAPDKKPAGFGFF